MVPSARVEQPSRLERRRDWTRAESVLRNPVARNFALLLLFTYLLSVTAFRGIQWPNDWAEAHWLIGYQFGFIKRGLVGHLFSLLPLGESREQAIRTASSLILSIYAALIIALSCRLARKEGNHPFVLSSVVLFLVSPFIVMTAHLNGYYDHLFFMLSIVSIYLTLKGRIVFASLVLSLGLLIHETIILVCLPISAYCILLTQPKTRSDSIRDLSILLFLPLLVLSFLFLYQSFLLDADEARKQMEAHLRQSGFIRTARFVIVPKEFSRSFIEKLFEELPFFYSRISDWFYLSRIVPFLLFVLAVVYVKLRDSRQLHLGMLLAVLCILSPLMLHLIAGDISRIWSYPLMAAYLVLWVVLEKTEKPLDPISLRPLSVILWVGAIAIYLLYSFSSYPLFDDRPERLDFAQRLYFYLPVLALLIGLAP
jgi:hypothetical protein